MHRDVNMLYDESDRYDEGKRKWLSGCVRRIPDKVEFTVVCPANDDSSKQ